MNTISKSYSSECSGISGILLRMEKIFNNAYLNRHVYHTNRGGYDEGYTDSLVKIRFENEKSDFLKLFKKLKV